MSFEIISDLHTELLSSKKITKLYELFSGKAENLILAGDIGDPFSKHFKQLLTHLAKLYKNVFLVAGNHEFYHHTVENTIQQLELVCSTFENIYFLNKTVLEFDTFIILGCTLWTTIIDEERSEVNEYMNDYRLIQNFYIETNNELHRKDFNWLRDQLLKFKLTSKPIIVVTHHLPDYSLIDRMYILNSTINSAFANQDCEPLLKLTNYWICGHTHKFAKFKIDDCICICNPLGYENENRNVKPQYIEL